MYQRCVNLVHLMSAELVVGAEWCAQLFPHLGKPRVGRRKRADAGNLPCLASIAIPFQKISPTDAPLRPSSVPSTGSRALAESLPQRPRKL
jgi:hypothetical protein